MKEYDYELPLLQTLIKLGGTARAKDALAVLEIQLTKKLNPGAREYGHNKIQKEVIWKNKTRWARQRLKEKGQIDGSVVGMWTITEKGRMRVDDFLKTGIDPEISFSQKKEVVDPLTNNSFILPKKEIGRKTEETRQIESIIREMISMDKNTINSEIVDEVKKRLNITVDKKKVSRIRNKIGLGSYDVWSATAKKIEEATIEKLALLIALNCVRNTVIETYHGQGKITDPEMMELNKEVVNKVYTFLRFYFGTMPKEETDQFMRMVSWFLPNWDKPKFDEDMMQGLAIAMGREKYKF